MSGNFKYIDDFFQGTMPETERENFLRRIEVEEEFAADVAFYLSTRNALRKKVVETKVYRWEKEFGTESFRKPPMRFIDVVKKRWYLAAAVIVLLVAGVYWLAMPPYTPSGLARRYYAQNLRQIQPSADDNRPQVLQAVDTYNRHHFRKARDMFEAIAEKEQFNNIVIRYAGLANMAIGEYNGAVYWFQNLIDQSSPSYTEGDFLLAMALLSRNEPDDRPRATRLLKKIVAGQQVGHQAAAEWLKATQRYFTEPQDSIPFRPSIAQ
jgi:cytochrome c-type biogenesis protein CcmH/NrfG